MPSTTIIKFRHICRINSKVHWRCEDVLKSTLLRRVLYFLFFILSSVCMSVLLIYLFTSLPPKMSKSLVEISMWHFWVHVYLFVCVFFHALYMTGGVSDFLLKSVCSCLPVYLLFQHWLCTSSSPQSFVNTTGWTLKKQAQSSLLIYRLHTQLHCL